MMKTDMPDDGIQFSASANYKRVLLQASKSRKEAEVASLIRWRGRGRGRRRGRGWPAKVVLHRNTNEADQLVETGVTSENLSHDNDATRRPDETLIIQSTVTVPSENQELPFKKNSLIWGVIESIEVLKRFPQKPHFLPLYDSKEECREGLAIASMVTFTSLAERVSRTRLDHPKSLLDGYLETLVELEELGFDVGSMRELLHKLISIKTKNEQTVNTFKEMEIQVKEQTQEKSKMEDEIKELEKKIKVAMSKKEKKDAELIMLQLSMDSVKGSREDARQEFDEVTASLRD